MNITENYKCINLKNKKYQVIEVEFFKYILSNGSHDSDVDNS